MPSINSKLTFFMVAVLLSSQSLLAADFVFNVPVMVSNVQLPEGVRNLAVSCSVRAGRNSVAGKTEVIRLTDGGYQGVKVIQVSYPADYAGPAANDYACFIFGSGNVRPSNNADCIPGRGICADPNEPFYVTTNWVNINQ